MDPDADPGGPKTYGSYGSGSATLNYEGSLAGLLPVQMVVEGAEWMVVGDQPELGAAVPAGAV
jgi:hypothetical protein